MIIALRTDSATAQLVLLRSDGSVIERQEWEAGRQLSGQLLLHIKELLAGHDADWNQLTGVIVYRGPGSFTGLRIGITVANTLAYAQEIPIIGALDDDWIAIGIQRLSSKQNDQQVVPEYGSLPHITRPKGSVSE